PVLTLLFRHRLDIDDIAGREDLGNALDRLRRPARRLCPFDTLERHDADFAILGYGAAGIARRLQADASRLIVHLKHHREAPRLYVGERLHFGELDPQSAPISIFVTGPRQPNASSK